MDLTPGLIPAYAGNTDEGEPGGGKRTAHPRLRGEHVLAGRGLSGLLGSSPPTRGTLLSLNLSYLTRGLIPAYAGNTSDLRP